MKTQKTTPLSPVGQVAGRPNAFTLIELLVVIIIIALLAAMLLPVLAKAKARGQNIKCLSNLKQLTIGWTSYTMDNTDKIAQNVASDVGGGGYAGSGTQANAQPGQTYASWVLGDAGTLDVTLITHGLIYPYVGNYQVYKCPADTKKTTSGAPSLRSYSANSWMDGDPPWGNNVVTQGDQVNWKKLTAINAMSTAMAMVFVEENPDSINDGYWAQNLDQPADWVDCPASYHINSGALSYADGHAEIKKWTDRSVLAGDFNGANGFPADPTSTDLPWVQARVTIYNH